MDMDPNLPISDLVAHCLKIRATSLELLATAIELHRDATLAVLRSRERRHFPGRWRRLFDTKQ